MGTPGKTGKQGIMGPAGPKGDIGFKGQKGDRGSAGMPGTKGEPGESISAPVVAVSPTNLTANESGTASFQCSVSGNPEPAVVWIKRGNLSEVSKSAISRGRLLLKNVSDLGEYQCSATNILGHAQTLVQLVVNGECLFKVLFTTGSQQKPDYEYTYHVVHLDLTVCFSLSFKSSFLCHNGMCIPVIGVSWKGIQ